MRMATYNHNNRKIEFGRIFLHDDVAGQESSGDGKVGDGNGPVELLAVKVERVFERIGCFCAENLDISKISAIEIGQKVDDAARQKNAHVELANKSSFFFSSPLGLASCCFLNTIL